MLSPYAQKQIYLLTLHASFPIQAFKNSHTIRHYDTTYAAEVVSQNERIINKSIRP